EERRFAKCLGRQGPGIGRGTAKERFFFNDGHLLAEVGRLRCSFFARGAGADDDKVEMGRHLETSLPREAKIALPLRLLEGAACLLSGLVSTKHASRALCGFSRRADVWPVLGRRDAGPTHSCRSLIVAVFTWPSSSRQGQ